MGDMCCFCMEIAKSFSWDYPTRTIGRSGSEWCNDFFLLILSLSGGVCRSEENILFFVTGHSDGNLYVACE